MESNGSPAPIFETDDQTYVLVTLPAHELFQADVQENDQDSNQVNLFSFSTLDDLVAFTNQATNQALAVLDKEVHGKVLDILKETANRSEEHKSDSSH